jgi:hypothetical protein
LEIENNSRYKKYSYTESARMVFWTNPLGQPSLNISPILSNEVGNSESECSDIFFIAVWF